MLLLFRDFTLNMKKEIRFALKQIYGVGLHKSNYIISKVVYPILFLLLILMLIIFQ